MITVINIHNNNCFIAKTGEPVLEMMKHLIWHYQH